MATVIHHGFVSEVYAIRSKLAESVSTLGELRKNGLTVKFSGVDEWMTIRFERDTMGFWWASYTPMEGDLVEVELDSELDEVTPENYPSDEFLAELTDLARYVYLFSDDERLDLIEAC